MSEGDYADLLQVLAELTRFMDSWPEWKREVRVTRFAALAERMESNA